MKHLPMMIVAMVLVVSGAALAQCGGGMAQMPGPAATGTAATDTPADQPAQPMAQAEWGGFTYVLRAQKLEKLDADGNAVKSVDVTCPMMGEGQMMGQGMTQSGETMMQGGCGMMSGQQGAMQGGCGMMSGQAMMSGQQGAMQGGCGMMSGQQATMQGGCPMSGQAVMSGQQGAMQGGCPMSGQAMMSGQQSGMQGGCSMMAMMGGGQMMGGQGMMGMGQGMKHGPSLTADASGVYLRHCRTLSTYDLDLNLTATEALQPSVCTMPASQAGGADERGINDGVVSLKVHPAQAGQGLSRLQLVVYGADMTPDAGAAVSAFIYPAGNAGAGKTVEVTGTDPGEFYGAADLSGAGASELAVRVKRPGMADEVVYYMLNVR